MPRKYEEPNQVIKVKQVKLTESTVLRMIINVYDERMTFDSRIWYNTKADPTFKPTGKGHTIPLDCLEEFTLGARKAISMAKKRGLLEDEEQQPPKRKRKVRTSERRQRKA